MTASPALACFISPHGLGHAARAAAVINATRRRLPELRVELFTTVPRWFLEDSVRGPFTLHRCKSDVGLVQRNALEADLEATLAALRPVLPPAPARLRELAESVRRGGCRAVLADVAPLGLAVAEAAEVPGVLVENFTWDWIYAPYVRRYPEFQRSIELVAELNGRAALHVQAEPVCRPLAAATTVAPIARPTRAGRGATRARLGLDRDATVVLITMGGTPWTMAGIDRLAALDLEVLMLTEADGAVLPDNVTVLPQRAGYYHPDLVAAADVVVGKLGYSTVTEALQVGAPFLHVERPGFAEAPILEAYLHAALPAVGVGLEAFTSGAWVDDLAEHAAHRARSPVRCDGAEGVAEQLVNLLER